MLRLYHNPRCSKSREALAILEAAGSEFETLRYLDNPPDEATLRALIAKLDTPVAELLRRNESEFKALGLKKDAIDEDTAVEALTEHPKLLQRPVLETDDHAVIGRPPERIRELLG